MAILGLALVLLTAADWYGTLIGDDARKVERFADPSLPGVAILEDGTAERAREVAEREERNLWQSGTAFDWLLLAGLVLTAALAVTAAVRGGQALERGTGPRAGPGGRSLATLAAWAALLVGVLVIVRLLAHPGAPAGTTIHSGLPLAMLALGLLAFAAGRAARAERGAPARATAAGPGAAAEERPPAAAVSDRAAAISDRAAASDADDDAPRPGSPPGGSYNRPG